MPEVLALAMLLCAVGPAAMFCINLAAYRRPEPSRDSSLPTISLLIPARDEERSIGAALQAALASTGVEFELVVMDDASTDRTAEIVRAFAAQDARVRLEQAPPLPPGWNGKQHACWALANVARNELLCFVDADVRLQPEALARMAAQLVHGRDGAGSSLISGFPRQETRTWLEWLLLPLIHFVLLGFLPVSRMRASTDPAFAAGCGQFLMVRREAYFASGGHSGIRTTMHDGLLLPRLLRQHGHATDLADLAPLATCRMYHNAAQVWSGLAKNATEGLAAPARIVPTTALLLLGQVLPFVAALWLLHSSARPVVMVLVVAAVVAAWLPRALAAERFGQSWRSVLLHPFGILVLLLIQWYALLRKLAGTPVEWKSRAYAKE
ncbi:MAG: glycosyltransferase [Acidobacteriota bacterium]|nr:glycosyltransferase [Acidobacteriota bacterium]